MHKAMKGTRVRIHAAYTNIMFYVPSTALPISGRGQGQAAFPSHAFAQQGWGIAGLASGVNGHASYPRLVLPLGLPWELLLEQPLGQAVPWTWLKSSLQH